VGAGVSLTAWWMTLASVTCFQLASLGGALADEVDEFDSGADGWAIYPSEMGRSSEPGWVTVTNDGEKALKTNPTGTKYTYYWKLTKDIDLTHVSSPSLELKYHFKGGGYEYMRVMVGEEGARRLGDFDVLHEQRSATADPELVTVDLSPYEGRIARVQILLRKPYNVVERRIGLYVHKVALKSPPVSVDLEERTGELRMSAFNVQVFGRSKADKPEVMSELVRIFSRFDALFMQEIRDSSGESPLALLDQLNEGAPGLYALELSPRLGRTISKEQYGFYYRSDKLRVISSSVPEDPADVFEREPFVLNLEHIPSGQRFWVLGTHLDPDAVPTEIAELERVYSELRAESPAAEPWIVWGDMNADCAYLTDNERPQTALLTSATLSSLINDEEDTTTTSTHCAYDRLFVSEALSGLVDESGVYNYEQELGLTGELTRAVSDHYPVWLRFSPEGLAEAP